MRQTIRWILILGATLTLFSGCATKTTNIDMNNDKGEAVMGLDYRDFQGAAQDMTESLLASGAVNKKDGGRYVLVVSRIVNDTMQHIDTDQLVKKIRVGLLRSGKVVVTTAVGVNGAEDKMAMQTRQELRDNEEFAQKTVAQKGQMIAPDLSLSGKILQRNIRVDSKTQRVEYYFQMSLTDIKTGLAFWEDERVIGKRGSNKSVAW
ncbi:MAG: penicillin-binding protein activator LpoB [Sulfurimonas sp.]|uniref:penicillin-binding protein activator LpoB n=1 Tax=Sulfurimonas sp. TaxID=2022749 RepID=UPI00260C964B|nr:penicillin-binding protein activator LpoB [Sulfurimonas sp.]MCW8895242.1 penicillin-binding protein activator LpoB [Sulfurimonas sp.]MCW8953676.1 penicillin-binding protein activator LpoB [Sulfurimonas sp.]MCW9067593.1 penicillin-binding protein activator LpoB [Sulfurimonas sp.]